MDAAKIASFSAADAKKLVAQDFQAKIVWLLEEIEKASIDGRDYIYVRELLSPEVIANMKSRGFKIIDFPAVAIQKEGIYYGLCW